MVVYRSDSSMQEIMLKTHLLEGLMSFFRGKSKLFLQEYQIQKDSEEN